MMLLVRKRKNNFFKYIIVNLIIEYANSRKGRSESKSTIGFLSRSTQELISEPSFVFL